jgi:hypothetical protein
MSEHSMVPALEFVITLCRPETARQYKSYVISYTIIKAFTYDQLIQ